MNIVYSEKIVDTCGDQLTSKVLKETFNEAIRINSKLISDNKRIAYFFIDPLIKNFEAANNFYFNILECDSVKKINTYKSGASPIQALSDAKELIDNNLYDAVFIFGQELLLSDTKKYGKNQIREAMNIFEDKSILECYNLIAHQLCQEIGLSKAQFFELSNKLYENYIKTYEGNNGANTIPNRGRLLEDLNAYLFRITDCANPNIDFAGGIIVTSDDTAEFLKIPKEEKIKVSGAEYRMIKGLPQNIDKIVGTKDSIFPHLKEAFIAAEKESKINFVKEFVNGNLLLEVYTCYPPIPIAFLLATKLIDDISEFNKFLDNHQITITGGLNLARAPWNNPTLNGLIDIHMKMKKETAKYGLVHGNGGIGEIQGVAILEKY